MAGRTRRTSLLLLLVAAAPALAGCLHDDNAWALEATGLAALRERGLTGRHVRVAVLDTGLDPDAGSLRHLLDDDLLNGEVVGYRDFVGEAGGPKDRDGHGTFVAGVLAGARGSGLDRLSPAPVVPGGAPHVHLLVARVSHGEQGSLRALVHALDWALDEQADVVSLSLGVPPKHVAEQPDLHRRFQELLARAEKDGVLVVAAAGNAGPLLFPAVHPTVLAVGATDRDLRPVRHPPGAKPVLHAPGRDITGPWTDGGLVGMDGTSAAVPFVAAAAALLISGGGDPADAKRVADLRTALLDGASTAHPDAPVLQAEQALRLYERSRWTL